MGNASSDVSQSILNRRREVAADQLRSRGEHGNDLLAVDEYVGGGYLAFPDPAAGGLPFPLGHAPAGTGPVQVGRIPARCVTARASRGPAPRAASIPCASL